MGEAWLARSNDHSIDRMVVSMKPALVERISIATGWKDGELATMLGVSRQCVQKYRSGELREYLNVKQKTILLRELRATGRDLAELIVELELQS
jgi:hypothetical protein